MPSLELVDPRTNRYLSGRFAPAPVTGAYTQAVLDPDAGTLERTVLREEISEFPWIDDRLLGRRHRYVTVGAAS